MKKITEMVEHPIPLGELHTMAEDFLTMGAPMDAPVSFRRVGRGESPVEVTCQWERSAEEPDGPAPAADES